ncbi:MAG: tripartite tricarboxylate transporter TctB family protein, partial [Rhodospirillales bacterium]
DLEILPRIIVGDEMNTRIKQRTEIFDSIKPKSRVELPDFTLWTLVSVGLFSLVVFWKRWMAPRAKIQKTDTPRLRYDVAFGTLLMSIVYVLLMGLRIMPFVWATIVFIVASGLFLTRCDKRKFVYVLEIALLMSFGLHFVFTQLFTIDLP